MKLGKAFSDSLIVEHRRERRFIKDDVKAWWFGFGRILIFAVVLFGCFFMLIIRLFELTVIRGHSYRTLSDGNRTRELVQHAPRGIILDRSGKPLVSNISQYRLIRPCADDEKIISQGGCVQYLSQAEGEKLDKQGLTAGSFLETDFERRYSLGESAAHVIGYTGEITDKELGDEYYSLRAYRRGDRLGRTGVEAVFEDRLRGRDGKELVEVDASGKIIRILGRDSEIPGTNVTLSLDLGLSEKVSRVFPKGTKGAVVVSKPSTGEILALFSSPTYDPNIFTRGLSTNEYQIIMKDPDLPLFDRAIGGVYPPGSTFKIVTAIAGLEEKNITADTLIQDTGVITTGSFSFANWYFTQYGKTEGAVDIVKAISRSNDIFFYKTGEMVGIDNLAFWGRKVGIGSLLGVELPGEATGLMPDPAWKDKQFQTPADLAARNNNWYAGDTYHVAIGQGYLLTTPLQVNNWTNLIASGGIWCQPTIEKTGPDTHHGANCRNLGIKKSTIDLISSGMEKACAQGGTGWPLFDFGITKPGEIKTGEASPSATIVKIPVACKTGTAEYGDPAGKTHAWFTVYAPVDSDTPDGNNDDISGTDKSIHGQPEISITVLMEGAGEGSSVAAPVAKQILEYWFSR